MISLTGPRHAGMFCLCSHLLLPQKSIYCLTVLLIDKIYSLEDYIETLVMLQYNSN